MYEQAIKELSSLLKGKRERAYNYLLATVRTDPKGVLDDFLRYADQKAWSYARGIFSANREGVFRAILARRIGKREEWILQMLGYSPYIPSLREFWRLYDEVSGYKMEGLGVIPDKYYSLLKNGKIKSAIEGIRKEAVKGRELKKIKESYEVYLSLARECGERIENVGIHIVNGELEEARRAIERINGDELRRKVRLVRERREVEEFLREFLWIPRCKEFLAEAEKKSSEEEIRKIKIEAESFVREVRKILQIWDDEEVRNLIKEDLERARKLAELKRRAFDIASELGGENTDLLREDFEGNLPKVLKRYIVERYPKADEEAMQLFEEALSVARSIEKDWQRAWVLSAIAGEMAKVDVDRAKRVFEEALSVARSIEDADDRARALSAIAGEMAKEKREEEVRKIPDGLIVKTFEKYGEKWVEKLLEIAKEYPELIQEANELRDKISALRHALEGSGVEVNIRIESDDYEYLKGVLPAVRNEVERLNKIAEEYKSLKGRWSSAIERLRKYRKALEGSGVHVEVPEIPKKYEEMKSGIDELERKVEEYRRLSEEYRDLRSMAMDLKEKLDDLRVKLKNAGIEVPSIDELSLDYLRAHAQKLKNFKSRIRELENLADEFESLKDQWRNLAEIRRRAGLNVGSTPQKYEELKRIVEKWNGEKHEANVAVEFNGDIVMDMWSKGEMEIKNVGEINVEDVNIEVHSDVMEVRGIRSIGVLKRGETRRISVRIKSKDAGYVPVEIKVKWKNPLTEKEEEKTIYPEIYVREKREIAVVSGGKEEKHIPLSEIKRMYGIKEEEKYKWGEFSVYRLGRIIGSGGFSVVYEVEKSGKKYAMKVPKGVDWKLGETLILKDKDLSSMERKP